MLFKVDENLPVDVANVLKSAGHGADTVWEEGLAGTQDPALAGILVLEQRVLVTLDKGFADIRTYPPSEHAGIILLRPKRADKPSILRLIRSIERLVETESIAGSLWIVEDDRIRIR